MPKFKLFDVPDFHVLLFGITFADVVNGAHGHINGHTAENDAKRQNRYQPLFGRKPAAHTA